jgi:hypothetical protein
MSREVVTSLYCHNHLISLVMLDRQRQPLMRINVKRREIWEWSDHTRSGKPDYRNYLAFYEFLHRGGVRLL